MENFTYITTFISVLVGLAMINLLYSFHKLLMSRKRITWNWIPLALAFTAFESLIVMWFNLKIELTSFFAESPFGLILFLLPTLCHLLFVIAVLPDKIPRKPFNLKSWYLGQANYLFTLLAIMMILLFINRIISDKVTRSEYVITLISFVIAILLSRNKNYLLHAIFVSIIIFLFHTAMLIRLFN